MIKINDNFKNQDILSIDQFSQKSLAKLFSVTKRMAKIGRNARPSFLLKGNIATLLFYEPSTRTFSSFSAAMKQLGGETLEITDPQNTSSYVKGESFEDTIKVLEAYCDIIVIRHPEEGSAKKAAEIAKFVPVINAGDGAGDHPTQALLDLYTIYEKFGRVNNLIGVIAGDALYGRGFRSLLKGLSIYKDNTVYLLTPKQLRLRREDFTELKNRGLKLIEIHDSKDIPKNAHFWYWTRIQKERFKNKSDYEKIKNSNFIVDKKLMREKAGKNMILMHVLPRVGEILPEVDEDTRAVYLRSQIRNGMYVRMALLALILGKAK